MQIFVKTLTGKTITLDVEALKLSLAELKLRVDDGVPTDVPVDDAQLWKDARQGYLTVCVWSDTQQQWVSAISCLDNLRAQLQYITVTFNGVEMVITHEEAPSLTVTELRARVEARFALVLEHARRPDIVNDGDKDGIDNHSDNHSATWSFVL